MTESDEMEAKLIKIFSHNPTSLETRIMMASFISSLLGNWARINNIHKIDVFSILKGIEMVLDNWNDFKEEK
jgi:hypothetical protein